MKSRITIEVNESDILNSIATQSKSEVFEFVDKVLNNHDHPSEIAHELRKHLADYINSYQSNESSYELLNHADENGKLIGKYKKKFKKRQFNKKVKQIDDDKPSRFCE